VGKEGKGVGATISIRNMDSTVVRGAFNTRMVGDNSKVVLSHNILEETNIMEDKMLREDGPHTREGAVVVDGLHSKEGVVREEPILARHQH